jgi:predicted Zn-dependent protease
MDMTKPALLAPPASLEEEVRRLRQAQSGGRHGEALPAARALLAQFPENRDLLLIEASALRHLGRIDEALAALDRLAALQPRFSLMHQERGLCHVAHKDAPTAIAALLLAVNLNPALPLSWRMLEGVYRITGDAANAAIAARHVATLAALPGPVVSATALFADGDLGPAEAMIRAFLLTHGDHPEGMRLLARIGIAREVYDDAEALLAGVLAMVPDHRAARADYVQALVLRHKHAEAREALAPLLAEDPANTAYRTLASSIAVGLGRQEEAIALYRAMLAELPADADLAARADLQLWLGHALKTIGEVPEAIAAYRAAAHARPDFGDSWWSLANLKTYRFTDSEIATMRSGEQAEATAPVDRVHLAFALGKALEDRGDYAGSWEHYARGNATQRAQSRYRPEIFETNTAEQKRICTPAFFATRVGWGCDAADPIFILGLPRAGSTLIEQILASHPEVEGTQELPDIQRYALELHGRDPDYANPRYPAALADLSPDQARALGERFLADTRAHRVAGRRFFIDKMPNNFRHIGLIQLILPRAKIIDARREPMACCFSNLKQLFATGQEFSYSIDDIARYYRTYLELMRHWDTALPGRVFRVIHEDVIEDLERQVRRILDHCGLPFDPACVDFHQTRRPVRTPSSEQVRQPIFRDGMEQWRNFAPMLEPLRAALGDALTRWRE